MTYRIGLIGLEQHVERVFGAVDNDPEIALVAVANAGERAVELAKRTRPPFMTIFTTSWRVMTSTSSRAFSCRSTRERPSSRRWKRGSRCSRRNRW